MADALLRLYERDLIEFHLNPPDFTLDIADSPIASPFARLQASQGSRIVNLKHETVELGDLEREIVTVLDGSHAKEQLLNHLAGLVQQGKLIVTEDGQAIASSEYQKENLSILLEDALKMLAKAALLLRQDGVVAKGRSNVKSGRLHSNEQAVKPTRVKRVLSKLRFGKSTQ